MKSKPFMSRTLSIASCLSGRQSNITTLLCGLSDPLTPFLLCEMCVLLLLATADVVTPSDSAMFLLQVKEVVSMRNVLRIYRVGCVVTSCSKILNPAYFDNLFSHLTLTKLLTLCITIKSNLHQKSIFVFIISLWYSQFQLCGCGNALGCIHWLNSVAKRLVCYEEPNGSKRNLHPGCPPLGCPSRFRSV